MVKINSDIIRSAYLWAEFKKNIENKWKTITSIAEIMWISQPALSRVLNWKVWWSDNMFQKIWKAIPLTEKEIDEIFMNADIEELKYKYWEDFLTRKEYSFEELLEMVREQKNLTAEELQAVRKFIEFTGWEK